jgi:hypothetical protein
MPLSVAAKALRRINQLVDMDAAVEIADQLSTCRRRHAMPGACTPQAFHRFDGDFRLRSLSCAALSSSAPDACTASPSRQETQKRP